MEHCSFMKRVRVLTEDDWRDIHRTHGALVELPGKFPEHYHQLRCMGCNAKLAILPPKAAAS